ARSCRRSSGGARLQLARAAEQDGDGGCAHVWLRPALGAARRDRPQGLIMAMNVGPSGDGDDDAALNSTINTTPLVDVMLVLLIIFLITIPAITHNVPLVLPKETNQARQTKPENINLSINHEGDVFWGTKPVPDMEALVDQLKTVSVKVPQPEVQIRGDQ